MYGGNSDSGNLNNRYNSYQHGGGGGGGNNSGGGGYVPPGRTYAEQQTNTIQDSVKTQYQAEEKAATVLSQMHTQRHQLQGAHNDVSKMREATEMAKREIADLHTKMQRKRHKLFAIIAALSIVDFLLFLRIVKCGGGFFC
jgi:hypothetical protein